MSRTPSAGGQPDAVLRWLQRHGFTANPFAEWEASKEEWLERYFVSLPLFDKLYGDPQNPQTVFLFAGRGCGKSAHRVIIQTLSRPINPNSNVLAIPYTDFTSFIDKSGTALTQVTLDSHLRTILRCALKILLDELTQRPASWSDLLSDEQAELKQLVSSFAPELLRPTNLARRLSKHSEDKVSLPDLQNAIRQNALGALAKESSLKSPVLVFWDSFLLTPPASETLDTFVAFRRYVDFVRATGLDAVYILVDGIDELLLSAESQVWGGFLVPLMTALPLMEMPHVAFKFFLPTTAGTALKRDETVRFDRFRVFDLLWDTESLRKLLAERLNSFNKRGVDSLKALADEKTQTIDDDMVRRAQGAPRAMILIGHLLFEAHCSNSKPDLYLNNTDFKKAVERFEREYRSLVTSVPLLRVDEKARVLYVGGRELNVKLSRREFDVLVFLYQAKGMIRSEQEIAEAIGGYVSNIAFDSMVSRLRAKFEPDPDNPLHLITERGRGYRLANTE